MSEREINRASPANDDAPVRLPTRRAFRPTSADVGREHTHPHTQREKKKKKKPSSSSISISTYTHKKNRPRFAAPRAVPPESPLSRAPRSPLAAAGVRRSVPRLARCPTLQRAPRPSFSPIAVADRELEADARSARYVTDSGDDATTRRGAAPLRASGYKPSRHDPAIEFCTVEYEVVVFM